MKENCDLTSEMSRHPHGIIKEDGDIAEHLRKVNTYLNLVLDNSEKEIIETGDKLQKYLTDTRDLSKTASKAASSISDEILQNGISELTSFLSQNSTYFKVSSKKTKNNKEELLLILPEINEIVDEFVGLKKVLKNLRMLGISTKIETSRLGTDDQGFNTLADHIDKLSGFIGDKAAAICNKAGFFLKDIYKTTGALEKLEKEQKEQVDLILNKTSFLLDSFNKQYQQYINKTGRISESTKHTAQNISDIVMSIQFHDIMRQQTEHVKDAIKKVLARIKQGDFDKRSNNSEELTFIYDVCELQSFQLKNSMDEFASAVRNIISNLENVKNNVNTIMLESSELLHANEQSKEDTLENIQKELELISGGLVKNSVIENELAVSIKSVLSIVDELTSYVSEIEEVGTEIEIIALNARIKAARTGSNALTLGVLAEAIQKLSNETKSQTISTYGVLNNIRNISKNLSTDDESGNSTKNNITSNKKNIAGLMRLMTGMEKEVRFSIEKVNVDVNSLKKDIENTISGITIHNRAQEIINNAIGELNSITGNLRMDTNFNTNQMRNTNALKEKYTMYSERSIHDKFIESQNKVTKKTNISKSTFADNQTDNNIELF